MTANTIYYCEMNITTLQEESVIIKCFDI